MGKDLKGKELGKGFNQRPDGRYCGRVQINGKSICKYNLSLQALKKELEEAKAEAAKQTLSTYSHDVTLNEWFETWFTNYKLPMLKGTGVSYRRQYKNYYGSRIGNKMLRDIIQLDIQIAIADMLEAGRSEKTIKEATGILRQLFEAAQANGMTNRNPVVGVITPTGTPAKRRVLTHAEQNEFVSYLKSVNHWYKEMYMIMLSTGLRIGEVGGLRWSDIDFENGFINVNQAYSCQYEEGKKISIMTLPKTANSVRSIPFFGDTKELLLSWKEKVELIKKKLGDRFRLPIGCEDIIFVTSMGSLVARYHAEGDLKKICKDINLIRFEEARRSGNEFVEMPKINPHAFRHTFCTRCFEKGMNPRIIQEIMGHENFSTTLSYSHVFEDMKKIEAEQIGNFFDEKPSTQLNKKAEYEKLIGII